MEKTNNELENSIWMAYRNDHQFDVFDLDNFVESAFKSSNELSYNECCRLALKIVGNRGTVPYSPDAFICFCREMIEKMHPEEVLVPFADGSETTIFPECAKVDYFFMDKYQEELAKKYLSITAVDQIPVDKKYNLILADLPLGPVNSKCLPTGRIVSECVNQLSEDGYAIFTFTKGITVGSGKKWLRGLSDNGLYCNAILDMPINSYGVITQVESVIAVFSKKKTEKLFVAPLADETIIDKIVANFVGGISSNSSPKLGMYVDGEVYSYSEYSDLCRIRNKYKSLSKAYNGQMVKLSDLGAIHAPDKNNRFKEGVTSIFIPKLGNSPVVASVEEFHIKPQNYFQVTINEDRILLRFILYFLNSEEGLVLRQLHCKGAMVKVFNTKILGELEVPCPSIELQSEYLATYEQLELLRSEVETLKDKFQKIPASYKNIRTEMKDINNHGDKFIQWIESLPYPIATILKRYSVSDDITKRQESLLYFFEAYSIFESTILSAALNKKMINSSSLSVVDSAFFEKASFGNWVRMNRALSNLYLDMFNSGDDLSKKAVLSCFQTEDENLVKYLCNKNVCNVLEQANDKRNLWKGHGGITSDAIYKEHVDTLDSLLRKLQGSIKDLYERIRLIRPIGLTYSNGQFDNKVEVLTGSNSIFVKDNIISLKPLDENKLYMQIMDTGEVLELPPYFILKNSPADAKNACYFYSRIEGGNTRYVSYHYDSKPEDTENGKVAFEIIKDLLSN